MQEAVPFSQFVNWLFYGLLAYVAVDIMRSIREVKDSIATLNTQVAVVISQTETHKELLDRHDGRLHSLETKGVISS